MKKLKKWLIKKLYIRLLKYDNQKNIQIVLQEMKDQIDPIWIDHHIYEKSEINMAIGALNWQKKHKSGWYSNRFRLISREENIITEK